MTYIYSCSSNKKLSPGCYIDTSDFDKLNENLSEVQNLSKVKEKKDEILRSFEIFIARIHIFPNITKVQCIFNDLSG
jgi:hypothetical protein